MDYIILNNDGSLNKQSLTRYINQGSHGVNEIFIGWVNATSSQILQAVFTLPNQLTNTELGVFEEDYEYEPGETMSGWVIILTENQTRYNGLLMVSARIILNGIVQVAYPFVLTINETGVRPETDSGVTLAQLDSYLLNIQTLITGAVQQNTDAALSPTSENPVQNKVITTAFNNAIAGVYKARGNETVNNLNSMTKTATMNGYVYNMSNSGVLLDSNQWEVSVQEGDNVVFIWNDGEWYWDRLSGIFDTSHLVTTDTNQDIDAQKNILNGKKINFVFGNSNWWIKNGNGELDFGTQENNLKLALNTTDAKFDTNIVPYSNNSKSLGDSTHYWKDAYLNGIIYFGSNNSRITNESGILTLYGGNDGVIQCKSLVECRGNRPTTTNTYDLGSSTFTWKDFYLSGKIYLGSGSNQFIYGDAYNRIGINNGFWFSALRMEPMGGDNAQDIGTSSNKVRDIYVGGNLSDGTNFISVANIGKKLYKHTIKSSGSDWTNMSLVIISTDNNAVSAALVLEFLFYNSSICAYLVDTNGLQSPVTNYYRPSITSIVFSAVSISGGSVSVVSGTLANADTIVDVVSEL